MANDKLEREMSFCFEREREIFNNVCFAEKHG